MQKILTAKIDGRKMKDDFEIIDAVFAEYNRLLDKLESDSDEE